jgi:uncharacterized protein YbaR (Trm112 family)
MIRPEFVLMLRCPVDGSSLELADQALIQAVNEAIGRSEAHDRIDQKVERVIDGGLRSGKWLYPIRDGIPTLVADEAIAIADFLDFIHRSHRN